MKGKDGRFETVAALMLWDSCQYGAETSGDRDDCREDGGRTEGRADRRGDKDKVSVTGRRQREWGETKENDKFEKVSETQ